MRKNSRIKSLRKKEKVQKFCRKLEKYDWLFVVSGHPSDLLLYLAVVLAGPGVYWCFVFGVPEDPRGMLTLYLVSDLLYTLMWAGRAGRKKDLKENPPLETGGDYVERILQQIRELSMADGTPIDDNASVRDETSFSQEIFLREGREDEKQ